MVKHVISTSQHDHHRAIPEGVVQHEHCEYGGVDDQQLVGARLAPRSRPHPHSSHLLHLQHLQSSGQAKVEHVVHAPHTRDEGVEQLVAGGGVLTAR